MEFYTMYIKSIEEFITLNFDRNQFPDRFFHFGIMSGSSIVEKPVEMFMHKEYGHKYSHIVSTTSAISFVISEVLYLELIKNGFTGFTSYQINCIDCQQKFVGISIIGRVNAQPDFSQSKLIYYTNGKPRFYKGLFFNMNSYDGSDFFYYYNKDGSINEFFLLLSQRAFNVIEKYKSDAIELLTFSETAVLVNSPHIQ
ncbi:MAG: hypothetical protein K9H61_13960 [Bacteroidia bacterium]|nr:hypothetical protein [Bacteroidia bacterium]MCF8427482.1 hypothetical protein [Bacteroidia bacterium]MCF8448091.1 hypothetical protein [Bacteroidia bacterium]